MTLESRVLAISVELCPAVCERQPSHVRNTSRTYLPPQPACDNSFGLHQPEWCACPSNLMKLEELNTNAVFNVGDKPFYIIGRNEKADIVLDSLFVSRYFALFTSQKPSMCDLFDQTTCCIVTPCTWRLVHYGFRISSWHLFGQ